MLLAELNLGNSVERGFTTFFEWLPNLIGAVVILVIGYIVAKVIGNLVGRVLAKAGLDKTLKQGQAGAMVQKLTSSPSGLVGRIVFWALFLGVISLSVATLGIDALTAFVAAVYAYLPNVLAAVLIFIVAGAIAGAVASLATKLMGDTGLGKVIATAAPILVMTIATFMILDQLKIAETIVTITYAGLIGAIALGSALAFGLGGREAAANVLGSAAGKMEENKDQMKRDLDTGLSRAKEEVADKKDDLAGQDPGDETRVGRPPVASTDRTGTSR